MNTDKNRINETNPYASTPAGRDDAAAEPRGTITPEGLKYYKETTKWASFLAVIIFIGAGFTIFSGFAVGVTGFFSQSMLVTETEELGQWGVFLFLGLGLFYILMGIFMVIPGRFLWLSRKFYTGYEAMGDAKILERSLKNQKSYFKFYGVITILALAAIPFTILVGLGALFFEAFL